MNIKEDNVVLFKFVRIREVKWFVWCDIVRKNWYLNLGLVVFKVLFYCFVILVLL